MPARVPPPPVRPRTPPATLPTALRPGVWFPAADERRLLGRFYVALWLTQALWLIQPFQFAYLYLAMDRPAWSVVPLVVSSAVALATELPSGVLADRWSRRKSVLAGGLVGAAGFAAVPAALSLGGHAQLAATSGAFALLGVGEALRSGAQEAWVVDNLRAAGREDLADGFFARSYSVIALGAAVAGIAAFVLLLAIDVAHVEILWYVAAAGLVVAVIVGARIPEHRPTTASDADPEARWQGLGYALRVIVRLRPLRYIALALVIASVSAGAADQVFDVVLLTNGFDARGFGPLAVVDQVIGVFAPPVGLLVARRYGGTRVLVALIALGSAATAVLFARHTLGVVLGLYVALDLLDDAWDPLAVARLQAAIPSASRATIGSAVWLANGVAGLAGLGIFASLLGRYGGELSSATPGLAQAFEGEGTTARLPAVFLGLPAPEAALVLFVGIGVLAVPWIVLSGRGAARRQS